jgi:cell wall-associated NlpC family hydrolase
MTTAHSTPGPHLARVLRRGTAATLALLILALAPATSAKPTREELEDAKARVAEMDESMGLLVEEFDQTQVALQEAEEHLAELRAIVQRAEATSERVAKRLAEAAREAYKDQGSQLGLLLSSSSFSDLSDRVYFLDNVAQQQEDIATRADVAAEEASRAAAQVQQVVAQQRQLLQRLNSQRAEIEAGIAEQQDLIESLEDELQREIERRQEAAAAAAAAAAAPAPQAPATNANPNPPPVSGSGASAAIAAAESVLGTPYVYGGASPQSGFDCSGHTMWAWAHAGVSLPHSSQMQYASLPHVDKADLQPGDLVFFYSPIHHVGLYVGGGMMIDAPHTGTVVQRRAIYWENYVGAARPG